jgi:membrane protease YdiL (CAAX protease family)
MIAALITGISTSRYIIAGVAFGSIVLATVSLLDVPLPGTPAQTVVRSAIGAVAAASALIVTAATFGAGSSKTLVENLRLRLPEQRRVLAFAIPIAAWITLVTVWRFTPFNPVVHPEAPDHVANIHVALGSYAFLTLAYLAVLVPIAEEILFRGLIVTYVGNATNIAIAILLSALVFALFHIDPHYFSINQVFFIACLGILLSTTVAVTHSIWPAAILHAMNNAFVSIQSI